MEHFNEAIIDLERYWDHVSPFEEPNNHMCLELRDQMLSNDTFFL